MLVDRVISYVAVGRKSVRDVEGGNQGEIFFAN